MEGKSSTVIESSATEQNGIEDLEVDITECTVLGGNGLVEAECQNTTENSSSFGATITGMDNNSASDDVEVESPFFGGNILTSGFELGNRELPVRKKLTNHWQKFIRPIMWRCKWIELQIKEFHSQARKYDRELAECDQRKLFEFKESTLEDFDSKLQPFSCQSQRNQIMKRMKRKRVEETTDLASYMSCHNLFSYHEYKKSVTDGAYMDSECRNLVIYADSKSDSGNENFGFAKEWPFLESKVDENSMGQMLSKIELVQSQVHKLRTRIDKVVNENTGKFSSINRLSLFAPLTSSDRNVTSPTKNGNEMPDRPVYIASRQSECNMEDPFMPQSAVSSRGEATLPPDTIRNTIQPQVGESCEPNKDNGLLIHSEASDEELHNFERIISQLTEKPQVLTRKLDAILPFEASDDESPTKSSEPDGQASTSTSNVCKNKRKWGSQKSRSGRWKRRSSG